jgi:hypothetical protein
MDRDLEVEVVPKVIKHLWLSDGNVILQTTSPSEDEIHLFRCHSSILSMHSVVFANMFERDNFVCVRRSEEYEGVPVISIPDASADVDALLSMLYNPLCVTLPHHDHRVVRLTILTRYDSFHIGKCRTGSITQKPSLRSKDLLN